MTSLIALPSFLAAQPAPGGGGMTLMFPLLMLAAMYFLLIAPQRKKQKEHAKMIDGLGAGDEIVTGGGIHGEITNKKDDRFVVKIAEGVKVEVSKAFVHTVVRKADGSK